MADILGRLETYAKSKTKDALGMIAGDVIGRIGSELGIGRSLTNALSGLAESLVRGSGVSFSVTQSINSLKLDSILSRSFDDFTGFSGKCPERASGADISAGRQPNAGDTSQFYNHVSPQGVTIRVRQEELRVGAIESLNEYAGESDYNMTMRFYKYTSSSLFARTNASGTLLQTIVFPIPAELVDNHGSEYDTANMKTVGDITGKSNPERGAGSAISAGMGVARAGLDAAEGVANRVPILGQSLQNMGVDTDTILNAVEQAYGVAPNPNPAVLFKGPRLREFSFNWILHPRSAAESQGIRNAIKSLKAYALPTPTFGQDTGLLSYPPMVMINFYPWDAAGTSNDYGWGDDTPIKIKRCFLSNVSVNYAPNGIPSFFAGTRDPVVIALSLQLKEIEFFTSLDIDSNLTNTDQTEFGPLTDRFAADGELETLRTQLTEAGVPISGSGG